MMMTMMIMMMMMMVRMGVVMMMIMMVRMGARAGAPTETVVGRNVAPRLGARARGSTHRDGCRTKCCATGRGADPP